MNARGCEMQIINGYMVILPISIFSVDTIVNNITDTLNELNFSGLVIIDTLILSLTYSTEKRYIVFPFHLRKFDALKGKYIQADFKINNYCNRYYFKHIDLVNNRGMLIRSAKVKVSRMLNCYNVIN
jgi:hypothetical protein